MPSEAFGFDRQEEVSMKLSALTIATLLTVGTIGSANALEFGVGPGGVYVGPGYDRPYYRDYRDDCRIVIRERTNRFGERVRIRERICD
ncbi:hypothetical protein [Bradyrhizobium sp. 170]|jgi:hypothetical protein|uniref:hypothetical protein n=1 Tax=Bradyrhizobium sp. 170 TaxID=2782641 RepID=UPI001FFF9A18|nr:hypothetical protein [Bradyrhizobium sp. 170]UPK00672.1 hypothetical protein IVB05_23310 [Bradyrhizobium sp. 170]